MGAVYEVLVLSVNKCWFLADRKFFFMSFYNGEMHEGRSWVVAVVIGAETAALTLYSFTMAVVQLIVVCYC